MSLIDNLFGSDKVRDGIINGVDSVVYTEQERAANHIRFLEMYAPFKLAQRFLAITFTVPFVLGWVAVFVARWFNVDVPPDASGMLEGKMGDVVLMIVGFYFFGGAISGGFNLVKK